MNIDVMRKPRGSIQDSLSEDVSLLILQWVHKRPSSRDLRNCLLVCQRWCDLAIPILYHDVVLRNTNISSFATGVRLPNASSVRSLTIHLDAEVPLKPLDQAADPAAFVEDVELMKRNGSAETQPLWQRLRDLAPILGGMTNLTTFSIRVVSKPAI